MATRRHVVRNAAAFSLAAVLSWVVGFLASFYITYVRYGRS